MFSKEGSLNDGHHGLLAVMHADAAVEMDVRFGIALSAFVKPTMALSAVVLSIRGVSEAIQIATALRLLLAFGHGLPELLHNFVSNDEINSAVERWQDIVEAAAKIHIYRLLPQIRDTPLYATAFLSMRTPRSARWTTG